MSVRWHHCIDHADTKQKPQMGPDCLFGVVPQPTDSRLSETSLYMASCLYKTRGIADGFFYKKNLKLCQGLRTERGQLVLYLKPTKYYINTISDKVPNILLPTHKTSWYHAVAEQALAMIWI